MKSITLASLAVLTAVNAASVTFKVIAPSCQGTVEVDINGQLTALTAADPDVPYFTGTAELGAEDSYKYVVDGAPEDCTRTLTTGSSTRNEFYNRPVTYANIPELPTILKDGSWTRGAVSDPIWDSNYIPTIFVTGNPEEMEDLIVNVPKTTYSTKITFIGPDQVSTFENCSLSLHRPGRKNNDAKQSWGWSLPEGKTMGGRSSFKIRHQEEDPTQLREKLYADISRKMGTYANEANLIRYYVNREGMGTFNMLDDVILYSYINAMFYNGAEPSERGGLYDGGSGATFNPADEFYSFTPNVDSPTDRDAIESFATEFSEVDFTNDTEVAEIANYFDYDQFLRFMVMEFLTGHWDGYWMEQTNIGFYIDAANNNKNYFLAQDFDATFGVNLAYEDDFVEMPYTEFPQKFPKAFLINKLLENPKVKQTFESYLTTTVQQIFNNETLAPYVTARHDFIYPDLEWDRSIEQRSPGNIFGWTAEQTSENLFEGVIAPGARSGGASYGLLEWVTAKEEAVRSSLTIPEKTPETPSQNQTQTPVEENTTTPQQPQENTNANAKQDSAIEEKNISAASIESAAAEEGLNSAATRMTMPAALSAMAVVGLIAALF